MPTLTPSPSPTPRPPVKARSVTVVAGAVVATGDFRGAGGTQTAIVDDPLGNFGMRISVGDGPNGASAAAWFAADPRFLELPRTKWAVLDADGDGRDDLVALYDSGGLTARLYLFHSTGTAFTYGGEPAWSGDLDWARSRDVVGGRFGTAGDALLVAYQDDGAQMRLLSFAASAGAFADPRTVYTSDAGAFDLARTRLAAGHFTRGGGAEELVALRQADTKAELVLLAPGADGFSASTLAETGGPFSVSRAVLAAGDVLGTGRDQVVAVSTDQYGSAKVELFDGTAGFAVTSASALVPQSVCAGPGYVSIGDWDRDGRADVAVLSPAVAPAPPELPALRVDLFRSSGSALGATPGTGELRCPVWPLNGVPLGFGDATKRPLYVKTDNNPHARPHYGISKADMVYEWLVEGLTTRLAAIYQSQSPDAIGSVRSVRMTDRHVLPSLGAALVYSGGGPEELQAVHYDASVADRYVNLTPSYGWGHRVGFRDPPYNFFTTYAAVQEALASAPDGDQPAIVAPWPFLPTADGDPKDGGFVGSVPASAITIPYRALFGVRYAYDAPSRTYARYEDGVREVDGANGEAIAAKNVVVIQTEIHFTTEFGLDPAGNPKLEEVLTGSGKGVVFRDGLRQDVTWTRDNVIDAFTLTNAYGERVLLDPGQTWVHVVPADWTIPSE